MTTGILQSAPRINGPRLLARLDELAAIGADSAGGVTRLAFSPTELTAKKLVADWLTAAGLTPAFDAAGNVIATRPGDGSARGTLATGSHVDSVVNAGPLDGAYGVVAAVEVAAALHAAGVTLHHDLVFVAFSNEEGARGAPGFTGSLAAAGAIDPALLAAPDDEGVSLADRLRDGGGDPGAIGTACWNEAPLEAFVELHVEQGPVLDAAGERLGVVTSCPGRMIIDVEINGAANHAGTTPMGLRADALAAGAQIVLAVEALATSGAVHVATTGLLHVEPGVRNVVPGAARLGVDLRDGDDAKLAAAVDQLVAEIAVIGQRRGVTTKVSARQAVAAVSCAPAIQDAIADVAGMHGLAARPMPSGAGHDAQVIAALGPVGMIFVPSSAGRSHCPEESTAPADLVLGANMLLAAMLELDVRLRPHRPNSPPEPTEPTEPRVTFVNRTPPRPELSDPASSVSPEALAVIAILSRTYDAQRLRLLERHGPGPYRTQPSPLRSLLAIEPAVLVDGVPASASIVDAVVKAPGLAGGAVVLPTFTGEDELAGAEAGWWDALLGDIERRLGLAPRSISVSLAADAAAGVRAGFADRTAG